MRRGKLARFLKLGARNAALAYEEAEEAYFQLCKAELEERMLDLDGHSANEDYP